MVARLDLDRLLAPDYVEGLEQLTMAEIRVRRAECGEVDTALSYLRRLIQGRTEILEAEIERRAEGGTGELADIIDHLPEILSEGGTRNVAGRLNSLELPDVNYRHLTAELDRIADIDTVGALPTMAEAEVRRLVAALLDLERTVSVQRRAIHERLDAFQGEMVRRYKSGEANVDNLLA